MKSIKISFSINGWVEQQINLTTDEYTPEQVMEMIEAGEVLTSISSTGDLVLVNDGKIKKIGEIVDTVFNDGEMFDFDLNDSWDIT